MPTTTNGNMRDLFASMPFSIRSIRDEIPGVFLFLFFFSIFISEQNTVFVAQLLVLSDIPTACSSLIFCVCRFLVFYCSFSHRFKCFREHLSFQVQRNVWKCLFSSLSLSFFSWQYRQFNFAKTVFCRVFVLIIFIFTALNMCVALFQFQLGTKSPKSGIKLLHKSCIIYSSVECCLDDTHIHTQREQSVHDFLFLYQIYVDDCDLLYIRKQKQNQMSTNVYFLSTYFGVCCSRLFVCFSRYSLLFWNSLFQTIGV